MRYFGRMPLSDEIQIERLTTVVLHCDYYLGRLKVFILNNITFDANYQRYTEAIFYTYLFKITMVNFRKCVKMEDR